MPGVQDFFEAEIGKMNLMSSSILSLWLWHIMLIIVETNFLFNLVSHNLFDMMDQWCLNGLTNEGKSFLIVLSLPSQSDPSTHRYFHIFVSTCVNQTVLGRVFGRNHWFSRSEAIEFSWWSLYLVAHSV